MAIHTTIFGCGNILLGDDGFGPAVIEAVIRSGLPEGVTALDVGTGVREHLIDFLLAPASRPDRLIVVDAAMFQNATPGTLQWIATRTIPARKTHDFSLHQFPTVNLLRELEQESGIEVLLLTVQAAWLPEQVHSGLSPRVQAAVPEACRMLLNASTNDRINRTAHHAL